MYSNPSTVKGFHSSISSRPAHCLKERRMQSVLRIKWPGRETGRSFPSSTEVKKMWIYTSIVRIFMASHLITQRYKCTFYILKRIFDRVFNALYFSVPLVILHKYYLCACLHRRGRYYDCGMR
jgi:hypothetical protein